MKIKESPSCIIIVHACNYALTVDRWKKVSSKHKTCFTSYIHHSMNKIYVKTEKCSVLCFYNRMENLIIWVHGIFHADPEEELTSMKINHSKFKLKSYQCGRSECLTLYNIQHLSCTHSHAHTHIVCHTHTHTLDSDTLPITRLKWVKPPKIEPEGARW